MVDREEGEDTKLASAKTKKRKTPCPDETSSSLFDENNNYFTAFPTQFIKSTLQEEEGMGILLKTAIDLVGSCSAIFIRNLLSQAVKQPSATTRKTQPHLADNDDNTIPTVNLTLDGLRQTIAQSEQFQFLEGVLDGLEEEDQETSAKSSSLLTSDFPKIGKKPVPVTRPKKVAPKTAANRILAKETLQAVVDDEISSPSTTRQIETILADDEDYD